VVPEPVWNSGCEEEFFVLTRNRTPVIQSTAIRFRHYL